MKKGNAIAERYADALFQASLSQDVLSSVSRDVQYLSDSLVQDQDLMKLLQNPLIAQENLVSAFEQIEKIFSFHTVTSTFIRLIIDHHRMELLADILERFAFKLKQHAGKRDAYVTSAYPLEEDQRHRLLDVLEKRLQAKVILHETQDPSLLGGVVVRVGSIKIDSSIRTHLLRLQQSLESLS